MSADNKLLKNTGPLERLFTGSSSAPILDFLMLAAEENRAYSDSEIARYSGLSLKKARATISNLLSSGLVAELILEDGQSNKSGKKKRRKKYTLNRDSEIIISLEKLVLSLTDTEIKKPQEVVVRKVSADTNIGHTKHEIGGAITELIEKGLVKLDNDQVKQD